METVELKDLWQQLGRQLERQQALELQRLRERAGQRLHDSLAPLRRGQWLQLALGIGLALLGIACWQRNPGSPGYLAAGIAVHGFGLLTAVLAGIALGRLRQLDYGAPVLQLENRLGQLRRFHVLNGMLAGWPWWVMWAVVLVALAGLAGLPAPQGASGWLWASAGIGALGWLGTAALYRWTRKSKRPGLARRAEDAVSGYSLRQAQAVIEELRRFEQD
jgi:hypothetical protein